MYKSSILLNLTLLILIVSGFNGYIIESGLLSLNRSVLNFILDAALFIVAFFSITNSIHARSLLLIFIIFLLFTFISFSLNIGEINLIAYLNGLREFIPYFLFPIIYLNILQSKWKNLFIKRFNIFLYVFLALQIPVSFYQFTIEGAGDAVGGTQGTGFSGILSFLIFLCTYYLIIQDFDENNVLLSLIRKSYLLVFWIPAFINETKISYLLIPLFLFLLVKIVFTNIPKFILIITIVIPFLYIFNSIYQSVTPQFDSNDFLSNDFLEAYLTGNEDQGDIPRFEKLAIFINEFNQKEILFGKGVGQFKGGTTLELTSFASKYEWLLQGSIPMLFFLLVQTGIIGTIIFLAYWIKLILYRYGKQKINYSKNILLFLTICFLIIQLYNDSFRSLFFCGIMMFILCYAIVAPLAIKKDILIKKSILV